MLSTTVAEEVKFKNVPEAPCCCFTNNCYDFASSLLKLVTRSRHGETLYTCLQSFHDVHILFQELLFKMSSSINKLGNGSMHVDETCVLHCFP